MTTRSKITKAIDKALEFKDDMKGAGMVTIKIPIALNGGIRDITIIQEKRVTV